ncbi:hypothetical protein A3D08_01835 [Candidatus Roizmanbacteria bacterium RIFCSPHIGHO2_02_FULL_43_11]|uniref:Uncharacterized protein n=1 Tax=Candidatus Roizmanbacteria bacterium RIFCSPHIGHO2_02_FULL_43_11 TaxID=1802043 RepID=A0A1F7HFA7_9BACT|nr:MAG: hypothetical protein A3D08_01835 [Candidatus Roizmanbacteria bacterium RIFCSPHIGHO2_02_FULL_43_11]
MAIKTFATHSFGCRVNHAEREEIERHMQKRGITYDGDAPDMFIINTCSITHNAERSARQLIYQTRRKHPNTKIIVTGCSATYWLKNGLYTDLPADMFVDNANKEFLVELALKKFVPKTKPKDHAFIEPPTDAFLSSNRAVIKIQDGCHRFCTFCIVPYLRGVPKSRNIKEIIKIIHEQSGLQEVILTAINTEAFGKETGEDLISLLRTIFAQTQVSRISFGSVHPWSITNEFLDFYQEPDSQKRLVHFFHIPLQSGSNKILQLMRRVHTREDMLERVRKMHSIHPKAFFSTDIIVGFLEEEDADFQETYEFLKESPISKFHVFPFSKRLQTGAYFMAKRLYEPSPEKKKERVALLRELSEKKYTAFQRSLIGYKSQALVLSKKKGGWPLALLDNQMLVLLRSLSAEPGGIVDVVVKDLESGQLIAARSHKNS